MARKLYSLKYEKVAQFAKENKADIKAHLSSTAFEYAKLFGNAQYEIRIKNFIEHFKIEKDRAYALEVISHFKSIGHIEKMLSHIGLLSFMDKNPKELFYIFVFLLERSKDETLKDIFFYQSFLFYVFTLNKSSNITLDYKPMTLSLLKTSHPDIKVKESFGEKDEGEGNISAYFTLELNNGHTIKELGTSIKTLRKKAYKQLFVNILDKNISLR